MTTTTEAAPKPVIPPQPDGLKLTTGAKYGAGSVGIGALLAWVGGVAGQDLAHVSVPFLPAWVAFMALVLAAHHLAGAVGAAWHAEASRAAPELAAKARTAELLAEQWVEGYGKAAFARQVGLPQ